MPERPQRILIADDREENRYVLRRVLERAGYLCDQASTGREALQKVESLPSVVILDVHLPDMSGYDVCRSIKQNPRTSHISILQISASFVANEDRARALEVGADAYLTHPIDGVVLLATVRSLLRLRAAEVLAHESAAQWQSTFDALSEGLAFVDLEGKLAQYNRAFSQLCGEQFSLENNRNAAQVLHELLGTSEPVEHHGDGRYSREFVAHGKTIQVSVDQVTSRGEPAGKILVLTDVSDRKLAEYALRTAEKLAETGKLAHAIAHEINNPLEALINLLYLGRSTSSIKDVQEYLARANDEVERIGRITKQSLSFHRDTQHSVSLDVGALITDVIALYRSTAASRGVGIVLERRPTLSIYGFPGQLTQVFANLIRNATEAAPANTSVTIRIRDSRRGSVHGTRVTIHDRGNGIPPGVQSQMFDPFFTTKELKGSGLGLWVSRALINKHRGTIRFRSRTQLGSSGTVFEVFLPIGGLGPHDTDESPKRN